MTQRGARAVVVLRTTPGVHHGRLLPPVGYMPPAEHEVTYYCGQSAPVDLLTLT